MRRVATATSIRGFDRSHILVQMFPVTLQLLRCSVGRDSAWRRPRMMGPAPHGVKRTDPGFGPPRRSASRRPRGGGTAANTRARPGAVKRAGHRRARRTPSRQSGPVSTSRMNAAPLSQHSERELDADRRCPSGRPGRRRGPGRASAAAPALRRRSPISMRRLLTVGQTARRPWSARISVTSSAYSRSPPTGRPRAIRVTLPDDRLEPLGQVHRGRLALEGRVGGDDDLHERRAVARRLVGAGEELADRAGARGRCRRSARSRRGGRGRGP